MEHVSSFMDDDLDHLLDDDLGRLLDDLTIQDHLNNTLFLGANEVPVNNTSLVDNTVPVAVIQVADNDVPGSNMVPADDTVSTPPPSIQNLPPELRIKIYGLVFKDSQMTVRVHDYNHRRNKAAAGKAKIESAIQAIQATNHYRLLLTCRQIYDDALASYWATSIVICEGRKGPCYLDEFIQVCPPALLNNVQHLRNINLPHLKATRLQDRPGLTAHALLKGLNNLKSCEIVIAKGDRKGRMWSRPFGIGCFRRNSMRCTTADELLLHGKFITERGRMPLKWLQETYGIPNDTKIHFLSRQSHSMTLPHSPEGFERELAQAVRTNFARRPHLLL